MNKVSVLGIEAKRPEEIGIFFRRRLMRKILRMLAKGDVLIKCWHNTLSIGTVHADVTASLVEPTLGHYLCLSLVLLVGEALNVLKQHLGVGGHDRPIDMPARVPER